MTAATAEYELDLFSRLLAAWIRSSATRPQARGGLATALNQFPAAVEQLIRQFVPHCTTSLDLTTRDQWILGPPIETHGGPLAFPVAAVAITREQDGVAATIRIALLQEHDGEPYAVGYRFETAEDVGKPHPYPHVQNITGWYHRQPCLLHPHSAGDDVSNCVTERLLTLRIDPDSKKDAALQLPPIDETRPAIPLPSRTLPGLGLAVITSLYGAEATQNLLETDRVLARPLADLEQEFGQVIGR